jgi:hypothetical protein
MVDADTERATMASETYAAAQKQLPVEQQPNNFDLFDWQSQKQRIVSTWSEVG